MKSLAYKKEYAFNAICPYYTMFPLEYPLSIIGKYKPHSPIVLDPFCGRGTTIYAARKHGLRAYGLDTSPIAAAIAQAKLASANIDAIMELAAKFVAIPPSKIPENDFFRAAFSPETLTQLCSLREGLSKARPSHEAAILRAAALGCLHGPAPTGEGTPSYFSSQMPRTFSSKPDYSVRYWRERGIKAPKVSVLDVLRKKLSRITDLDSPTTGRLTDIKCKDARKKESYRSVQAANLIITSPPYYGMRTYVEDQWLRSWFLGGPDQVAYGNAQQLRHSGHRVFVTELSRVWTNAFHSSQKDAHLYIRFGAIPSAKSDPREILKASLKESGGWELVSVRNASTADAGKRQANQMGRDSIPATEFDFHAIRTSAI
jgi:hypothetical protein